MKYRKKPVIVEAFRLGHDPFPEWLMEPNWKSIVSVIYEARGEYTVEIVTPEGKMTAYNGDYIIRGVAGEIYPCKPDIFEMTYEKEDG